jgi:WD40 repeat protein
VFGRILVFSPEAIEPLQFILEDGRLSSRTDLDTMVFFAWSPNGDSLVMTENSWAKTERNISRHQIVLFDVRRRNIRVLRATSQYRWSFNPEWSPSGRYVAVTRWFDSGEPIILWAFDENRPLDCVAADKSLCESGVWCVAFSPDERCLAALAYADHHSVLLLLDVPSLKLIKRAELSFTPTLLSWDGTNRTLVLAGSSDSGATALFDPNTGQLVTIPFDSSSSACCHPSQSIAAFASQHKITIGDLSQGANLSEQTLAAEEFINDMCWNVEGTILYAVSNLGRVYTYNSTS